MSVLFSEMGKISYSTLKKLCSRNQSEVELAFTTIFEKYRYLVYYVSFDILKNEEEAKDIVNEAFLRMYDRRTSFMKEGQLKYFLLVTARNLSIDRYRELRNEMAKPLSGAAENKRSQTTPAGVPGTGQHGRGR